MSLVKSLLSRQIGAACVKSAARFTMPKHMSVAQAKAFSTYYLQTHEYVTIDGDIGTVGISGHAADALGDIVFVDLPSVGTAVTATESFGSVESVKAASDVYAPLSGEVVEINTELEGTPGLVNEAPLGKGWFIKIKMSDASEVGKLLNQEKYEKFCEESEH